MGILDWATSPWGQSVPVHIAWFLAWVAAIAALLFLIAHAIYLRWYAPPQEFAGLPSAELAGQVPERISRHSLLARAFHWLMAASMFALLVTAFLPKAGLKFDWVAYHWIAGTVLTISVAVHILHGSFAMDFWSIWPDQADREDARRRLRRFFKQPAPPPRRFAKYPLENKLYHGLIMLAGLAAILTGVFMMFRVRTPFFSRNPYLFGDLAWGWLYVLHGLAGVALIALVIMHLHFAVRPEKWDITKSMVFGSMKREFYLRHYDPERWPAPAGEKTTAP
jgi:formate dehydrogenase subunit gamma